jgi:hypothetical protein
MRTKSAIINKNRTTETSKMPKEIIEQKGETTRITAE